MSIAAACVATTGFAQHAGFTGDAGAMSNSQPYAGYFQEVSVEPTAEPDGAAPPSESPLGLYVPPPSGAGCLDGSCLSGACGTGCCETSCYDTGCCGGCSGYGCESCCCVNPFAHRNGVFAEFLFLRPRDAEVTFAVPGTVAVLGPAGTPATVVPQGSALTLNPDHQPAYRVGGTLRFSDEMSVRLSYTDFESSTTHAGALDAGVIGVNTMFPVLLHPATQTPAAIGNIAAAGRYDIDYEAVDLDTRVLLWNSNTMAINAVGGARWTQLDQDLHVDYAINGLTEVETHSRFDGIGARMGLDGEYRSASGFGAYGGGVLNLMFGNARIRHDQLDTINGPATFTNDEFGRLAPILELEFGGQWVSQNGTVRVRGGYMSSQWFNIVTVRDYANGLRDSQFDDFSDTITFDGFTGRVEVAF